MKNNPRDLERYKIREKIGSGSYGIVYKGEDRLTGMIVALKYISKKGKKPKQIQDQRQENQMLKTVTHENIIRLIEVIETQTNMIIITEYAGHDLANLMEKKNKKGFPYEDVKKISQQIFAAMWYLREKKIMHRDLKPQNILIKDGMIKLCDFGFARKLSASTNFVNSVKGTPLYIAPEILDQKSYDFKVDVWSFGIIIYELYTGAPPFHANKLQQLIPQIKNYPVRYPPNFPKDLKQLIDGMLEKKPYMRLDWQGVKKHPFFQKNEPLSQLEYNNKSQVKGSIAVLEEFEAFAEKEQIIEMKKENNVRMEKNTKKVKKMETEDTITELELLDKQIIASSVNLKELKTSNSLFNKLLSVLGVACTEDEKLMSKDSLFKVCRILFNLLTKIKLTSPDDIQNDITRKKQILFFMIKLVENQQEPKLVAMELMVIGFMLKNNFDNISVDFDTDEDISDICVEIIRNPQNGECFRNALTVLGILACQAILTLAKSGPFIKRIEEEKTLVTVAQCFSEENAKIVLECLEKFIHPSLQGETNGQIQLNKAFQSMKSQVATTLLAKRFIPNRKSPILIFSDPSTIQSYCKILYQCLLVSKKARQEFMTHDYWKDLATVKNIRIYYLAYDYILNTKENYRLITHETIQSEYIRQPIDSKLMGVFLVAKAYYDLSQKKNSHKKWESAQTILLQLSEQVKTDEDVKIKACREVEGFLSFGDRLFDNALANTFSNLMEDILVQNPDIINQNLCEAIFDKLLTLNSSNRLKITEGTTGKLIILADEVFKKPSKKLLQTFSIIFKYFIENEIFYKIHQKQTPAFNTKFLTSTLAFLKHIYSDQNYQKELQLHLMAEGAHLHKLLLMGDDLNERSITVGLNFILKIQGKCTRQTMNFLGNKILLRLKPYLLTQEPDLLYEILQSINVLIKQNEQYIKQIDQLGIISHIPTYLNHHYELIRHQAFTLIGNLSKHSQYFFPQYQKYHIFHAVTESLKKHELTKRILKGAIYAVGNVSFYTDKFASEIKPIIPVFQKALSSIDQDYFIANVFSTISNLLRHSNVYLASLLKHHVIQQVLQILSETKNSGQKLVFGLKLLLKVLKYPQIFSTIPKQKFKQVCQQKRALFPTDQNIKNLYKILN